MHFRSIQRVLAAVVALSLGATGANACNKSTSPTPSGPTVVAFGDSLVTGVGTTGGGNFVSVLSGRVGVTIRNAGRPGDTTGTALTRLDADVIARDPDLVIVLLGGNDLLQGLPVQQRVTNITTIAQRIRGSGARVILIGLGQGQIDPYEGTLPGIATSTGSAYVPDVLQGIFGNSSLMFDLIHPNNAGHALMADRIEPTLRAELAMLGASAVTAAR
jgi:acyl-CoA thioesterase-1